MKSATSQVYQHFLFISPSLSHIDVGIRSLPEEWVQKRTMGTALAANVLGMSADHSGFNRTEEYIRRSGFSEFVGLRSVYDIHN